MKKNTTTLGKYLISKGINSSLKLQKILFFFRVEELRTKKESGYFKKDNNFQAWIYGPVNVDSFFELQDYFHETEEKEFYLLEKQEIEELDLIFEKTFSKYADMSPSELVDKSHLNLSWINARGDLGADEPCKNFMKEDDTFIKFK